MIKRSTDKLTKLRRGTQELLERRSMAASPAPVAPKLRHRAMSAGQPSAFADPFAHGGRNAPVAAAAVASSGRHPELYGHRHRGAEKHSAHGGF
jgi:hypothetical protein